MATTQNRTFFGGSTTPGSGVYPEDVKLLKVFRNYAETDYDPLANSDTSVYIPTVEKVDSSGTGIHVTIQKILASTGYPVLVYGDEEYQYITTGGTPSKYVFMCLSDLSTLKRLEVDVATGTINASTSTIAGVNYIGRSASNIYSKIVSTFTQNRLPVIVDDSAYYQLAYAWNGVVKFTRLDDTDDSFHILSINSGNTITESAIKCTELLQIVKSDPEMSGLTQAEYTALSQYKAAILEYGSGSTLRYAYLVSVGTNTWFIHQSNTGYDLFTVAPAPTDPDDPTSTHTVTKTSYTYGSSAMTMRNFEASDATDTVNGHSAFPLDNDEFWVIEDWDGGWNAQYAFVAPSDSDNNCVVRFENVTFNTAHYPTGYPIEIWNHSKGAQLTPLSGSITAMQKDCSYEIRIYGDKYYCCKVWNAQNTPVAIYGTLQNAIADADNLSIGDIFETNGFHTSGDGGAARYLVSDTGTANGMDIIQLAAGKLAVLENSGIVVPEQFGAYGNGSTDDTAVFDYLISNANVKSIVLSANKIYEIQFKNWTLVNKSIYGLNKDSSRLSQSSTNLNKPLFTLGTNCDVGNMTIICGGGNTIRTGLFHFGNDEGGTFRPFIGTHIHDIHAYCVSNIIAVDISYAINGSYNLKITHCKFDNPGIGVRISNLGDTTHQSYVSDFYFEDILVSGPYSYGFEIDKAQSGGMMVSHGLLSQFSVQLKRDGSCGFKLTHGDISLINPTAFIENDTGTVYSVELDFNKIYPSNFTNGISSCYGGILEGIIKNKEYLDKISWKNTDFVEEAKFSDNTTGVRPTSRHLSTTPVSVYHKTAEQTYSMASVTNGTKTLVDDKYGQVIEVAVSDFGQDYTEIDIPVTLPIENFITAEVLLLYTNAFKINATSGNKFPCLILTDSNGNDVYDVSGISLEGRYGRVTMDVFQTYYGLNACFDITGLNRASAWKLKVKIPTEFSSAVENAKFQLLGLNVYLHYATPPDIRIETIRNEEWYNREPIGVISQNAVASSGGQLLTFTFTQEKFTRLAFITFTIKDLVLTADEDLTVEIMSGSTTIRSYTMSLKAGTHSFEVSISTGGTSYTPKLMLTSSNQLISGGTYTCYVQGVSY